MLLTLEGLLVGLIRFAPSLHCTKAVRVRSESYSANLSAFEGPVLSGGR